MKKSFLHNVFLSQSFVNLIILKFNSSDKKIFTFFSVEISHKAVGKCQQIHKALNLENPLAQKSWAERFKKPAKDRYLRIPSGFFPLQAWFNIATAFDSYQKNDTFWRKKASRLPRKLSQVISRAFLRLRLKTFH